MSDQPTPSEVGAIRARLKAFESPRVPNVTAIKFYASAPDDIRTLLGLLDQCMEQLDEWVRDPDDYQSFDFCTSCRQWRDDGHAPDCRRVALLANLGGVT